MVKRFVLPLIPAALLIQAPSLLSAAEPATGRGIYLQRCEPCHGADGAAQTPMGRSFKIRSLQSPEVQKQSDTALYTVIAKGRNGRMPAFGESLGEAKIKQVIAYMRKMNGAGKK